jgi:beta-lysine 5,6-aminomutase beta subunit
VVEVGHQTMSKEDVESFIEKHFEEPLVFVGASTGTDAHTVGIDAIMNMKGYNGNYGLERYKGIKAYNLGGQVDNETLLEKAIELKADVILISQTVTQKDVHIENLTRFIELLEAENKRDDFIVIIGGPRIHHGLAKELGYDAGFGPKKYAFDVASFAVQYLFEKGIKVKR